MKKPASKRTRLNSQLAPVTDSAQTDGNADRVAERRESDPTVDDSRVPGDRVFRLALVQRQLGRRPRQLDGRDGAGKAAAKVGPTRSPVSSASS